MGLAMVGRPRKPNVKRDASGKSRGEVIDFAVVLNQPHRRGARDPMSQLLGYPLGRLHLVGLISESQLRTGNAFAGLVRAYSRMLGLPSAMPKGGAIADRAASGFYTWEGEKFEVDEQEAERRRAALRSRYDECFEILGDLGRVLGRQRDFLIKLRRVCIEELAPGNDEIGDVRLGLNALERVLQTGK